MNTLTNAASGGLPSLAELRKGMTVTSQTVDTGGPGSDLLRLVNGKWVYGPSNNEVEAGSVWAINVYAMQKGFVAWTDRYEEDPRTRKRRAIKNEVKGERMVSITAPMPADLPEIFDEAKYLEEDADGNAIPIQWTEQYSMDMICCTGEDRETQICYRTNSVGGRRLVQDILNKIVARLDKEADKPQEEQAIIPLVKLDTSSYTHKVHGEIINPVFTVVDWTTLEGAGTYEADIAGFEDVPDPDDTSPAPVRRRKRR